MVIPSGRSRPSAFGNHRERDPHLIVSARVQRLCREPREAIAIH
jgi:hypothetical protein